MRRKRSDWTAATLILAALCVGLAIAIAVVVSQRPAGARRNSATTTKVTYANYRRIQEGMTRAEVVRILGKSYTSTFEWNFPAETDIGDFEALQWKQSDDAVAVIGFRNGRVFYRGHAGLK